MPLSRKVLVYALVLGAALLLLGLYAGDHGIATSYVDPVKKLQAQDEAIYAASTIRMATRGDWLTPFFLGRFALYKPPLLYWLSALSVKIGGTSEASLRAPSVLAGALTLLLIFAVVWRLRCMPGAIAAVLLLGANHMFHTLSRIATMDAPLLFFTSSAILILALDAKLEYRRSAVLFGAACGLAIMTKAVAGVLPLVVLAIYFAIVRRKDRPSTIRVLQATLTAAIVALPWHLYQLVVHTRWFWNEYILTEHLALGLSAPQTSVEGPALFYPGRLWLTDPVLCAIALFALPALRHRSPRNMLCAAWIAGVILTLFVFQYRGAWYLLPLIAALAFTAGLNLAAPRIAVAILSLALIGKIGMPHSRFGLSYEAQSVIPSAERLEARCAADSSRPLFLVDSDDQFYASDLAFPEIHYVYTTNLPPIRKGSLDLGYLGIAVTADQFRDREKLRPVFRERLRDWGLDSGEAIATLILAPGGFIPPARDDSPVRSRPPVRGWCGSRD